MTFADILVKMGKFFTSLITKPMAIEFFFGSSIPFLTKLFRFYGMVAFITLFITAGITAFQTGGTFLAMILTFILELVKTIIGMDQQIYDMAISFYFNPANHTAFHSIITSIIIFSKSFFYIWWFRTIRNLVKNHSWVFPMNLITQLFGLKKEEQNASLLDSRVNWISFKMMYVLMMIVNIFYLIFISKTISFAFVQASGEWYMWILPILRNIWHVIYILLINIPLWIFAFKGVVAAFVLVILKTIFILFLKSTPFPLQDFVNQTINNTQNIT